MRSSTTPSQRDGFTLIELLVVISILAILAGLTLAGISRVRAGQYRATTESTVKKLQVALDQQLRTANEEATKENNRALSSVTTFCDGDKDRAKSWLSFANAKREFPQTFAEAKSAMVLTDPSTGAVVFSSQASATFARLPPGASGLTADQESAVLLYLIVTEKANKGTSSTGDAFASATMAIKSTTNVEYTVFKDGYGTHLAFIRWYGANPLNPEVQAAPYVNAKIAIKDPFDPLGKLLPVPNAFGAAGWSNTSYRNQALAVLTAPVGSPPIAFDGLNKMLTVISAGPDKVFGTGDDVFGYPLARLGAKGD